MRKIIYTLPLLLLAKSICAQTDQGSIRITGRVINKTDQRPVPMATVSLKHQKNVTSTDSSGTFQIVFQGLPDTIIVTHIGFRTLETPLDKPGTHLLLELTPVSGILEEVILQTGLQRIPNERATGSFYLMDTKNINLQVGGNIIQRINGMASSVLFDDTKNMSENRKLGFSIRGMATINGSQDPLIIVDNFPFEGSINNINPNDIESITILKDAAAASIWGSKAGNGVVVITTKKSKLNQRLQIEMNSNVIITEKPDLYYLPQINISDYVDVEESLFNLGYFNGSLGLPNQIALSPVVEMLAKRQQNLISAGDSAAQMDLFKAQDTRTQYKDLIYRPEILQTNFLSVRGAGNKAAYGISVGYDYNRGFLQNTTERFTVRLDNSYKITDNLLVTLNTWYTSTNANNGRTGYANNGIVVGGRSVPYIYIADQHHQPLPVAQLYRQNYIDTAGQGYLLDWNNYPLTDDSHIQTRNTTNSLLANMAIQYRILPALSMEARYQYEQQLIRNNSLNEPESFETRNLINTFSQLNYDNGMVTRAVPLGGILNQSHSSIHAHNARAQFSFHKNWHEHEITAIAGIEIRDAQTNAQANRIYGYNSDILTSGFVDMVNPYPTFVTGTPEFIPGVQTFQEFRNRFVSFFSNAGYTFKNRYLVSASFRRDASNLFGVNANDKWLPFWSAGLGWEISKENFYHSSAFPFLKLRATYGFSGNVDQSKSAVTVMGYFGSNNRYTGQPQALITQFANNKLSWEKVSQLNLALDFTTRNRRLSGSLEYYRKKGIDLFGPTPIDYTAGLATSLVTKNIAEMVGNGIDLTLQVNLFTKSFHWSVTALVSYNESKTTNYYTPEGFRFSPQSGQSISPLIGKSLYSILSYQWAGLDPQGNPQGYLNKEPSTNYLAIMNAITSPDSLIYSGPAVPRFFGSIRNTLAWKGFTLDINISFKAGYYFRKPTISYDQLVNFGIGHSDYGLRWQHTGDEIKTNVPSFIYPINSNARRRDQFYAQSAVTAEKADHIRLQFINLEYALNPSFLKSSPLRQLNIYANLSNLGLIWKANDVGIDPDHVSNLLASKRYAIGIRVSF